MKTTRIIAFAALLLCCLSCTRTKPKEDTEYVLKEVLEVAGRQGVATDGSFYYVSGSTALYKYDMQGNLLLSNEEPFLGLEKECNHIGDIDVHQGEFYGRRRHEHTGCDL